MLEICVIPILISLLTYRPELVHDPRYIMLESTLISPLKTLNSLSNMSCPCVFPGNIISGIRAHSYVLRLSYVLLLLWTMQITGALGSFGRVLYVEVFLFC